jgi:hypothetical protein
VRQSSVQCGGAIVWCATTLCRLKAAQTRLGAVHLIPASLSAPTVGDPSVSFVVYLTTRLLNNSLERILAQYRYYPDISWRNWRKPRKYSNHDMSWPRFEPKTSLIQELYHYTKLLVSSVTYYPFKVQWYLYVPLTLTLKLPYVFRIIRCQLLP